MSSFPTSPTAQRGTASDPAAAAPVAPARERQHSRGDARPDARPDAPADAVRAGRVSVVIPAYGHREFVLETIASAMTQTYADVEIIVVNDGSPDDTRTVVRPLVDAGRIRYVEQPNGGVARARNRGLSLATGEFVSFLDDDDRWLPDSIACLVEALRARPAAVMAYGDARRIEPDGQIRPQRLEHRPDGDAHAPFRLRNWLNSPGQALIRTLAIRDIGGFDPGIWGSDDWDCYIRLAKRGDFAYRQRPILDYRVHGTNASRRAMLHTRNHLKVVRKHIRWDLVTLVRHQLFAAGYFVPNLLEEANEARREGRRTDAFRAHCYALLFSPQLVAQPWFVRSMVEGALGRPPRR